MLRRYLHAAGVAGGSRRPKLEMSILGDVASTSNDQLDEIADQALLAWNAIERDAHHDESRTGTARFTLTGHNGGTLEIEVPLPLAGQSEAALAAAAGQRESGKGRRRGGTDDGNTRLAALAEWIAIVGDGRDRQGRGQRGPRKRWPRTLTRTCELDTDAPGDLRDALKLVADDAAWLYCAWWMLGGRTTGRRNYPTRMHECSAEEMRTLFGIERRGDGAASRDSTEEPWKTPAEVEAEAIRMAGPIYVRGEAWYRPADDADGRAGANGTQRQGGVPAMDARPARTAQDQIDRARGKDGAVGGAMERAERRLQGRNHRGSDRMARDHRVDRVRERLTRQAPTMKEHYVPTDPTRLDLRVESDDPRAQTAYTDAAAAAEAATALGRPVKRQLSTRPVAPLPAWITAIDGKPISRRSASDDDARRQPTVADWRRSDGDAEVVIGKVPRPAGPWTTDEGIGKLMVMGHAGSPIPKGAFAEQTDSERLVCERDEPGGMLVVRRTMEAATATGGIAWFAGGNARGVAVRRLDGSDWIAADGKSAEPPGVNAVLIVDADEADRMEGDADQRALNYIEQIRGWAANEGHQARLDEKHRCGECCGAHWATTETRPRRCTLQQAEADAAALRKHATTHGCGGFEPVEDEAG